MKLYVGTLYTIENEFDECCDSIKRQTYKSFDHLIFKDLPNIEAHLALYNSFIEKKDKYDVLVKIDADMVLVSDSLFENIVAKLQSNNGIDLFAIGVYDFFSDQLIWGLNTYRNTVRWNLGKENLFVDISDVPANRVYYDTKELAPAAIHCKNPSSFQAFHYGIHRGLKVIQPSRTEKKIDNSRNHWRTLERVWLNFQRTKDTRVGLAALGAELAYAGKFHIGDLDYSNPRIRQVLEKYISMDVRHLDYEIKRLRLLNWGWLPGERRWQFFNRFH